MKRVAGKSHERLTVKTSAGRIAVSSCFGLGLEDSAYFSLCAFTSCIQSAQQKYKLTTYTENPDIIIIRMKFMVKNL